MHIEQLHAIAAGLAPGEARDEAAPVGESPG
jgi:hypothetical protein